MFREDARYRVRILRGAERLAVRCRTLIDGTGADPLEDAMVLIEDGRIVDVSSGSVPRGFEILDGSTGTLLPGFIDAHVHLTGETTFDPYRRYLSPRAGVRLIRAALHAQVLLRRGFTTLRDHGMGFGRDVKAAIESGDMPGPRILTAVNPISQTGGHGDWPHLPYEYVAAHSDRAFLADGPDECRFMVRYALREGADFIKIFLASGGVTNDVADLSFTANFTLEEACAMVEEAHRMGVPVAAHCMGLESLQTALAAGVDTIEHGMMEEPSAEILRMIAESRAIFVPTLAIFHWVALEGQRYGVPAAGLAVARSRLATHKRTIALGHELGVLFALGTDNTGLLGDNNNAIEFQLLVEAGLSPMEAIVSGTKHGAEALVLHDEVGTIAPGKRADLVLVDGNPLNDIALLQRAPRAVLMSPARRRSDGLGLQAERQTVGGEAWKND